MKNISIFSWRYSTASFRAAVVPASENFFFTTRCSHLPWSGKHGKWIQLLNFSGQMWEEKRALKFRKFFFSWSSRWGIKIGYERVRQHFRMNKLRSLSHKEASLLDCRREKCKIVKYSQRKFLLQTATSSLSVEKISIFSPLCFLWNVLASDSGGKGDENLIEISLFPSSEIHIV